MPPAKDQMLPFLKAVVVGTLTGIVFGVVFLALPGAALLIVVGTMGLHWDLSWIPDVSTIMAIGGIVGAVFAALLFVKDKHIPYVEDVQDFEED
jgi:membrane associated rhomboid family serine protease